MTTLENYNGVSPDEDESEKYDKERMHYVGAPKAREATKDVADGINGSLTLTQGDLAAINAKANSRIGILAEANGNQATTETDVHASGNSATLPIDTRRKLDLSPGDSFHIWIQLVERTPTDTSRTTTDSQPSGSSASTDGGTDSDVTSSRYGLRFSGGDLLHHVPSHEAPETNCGISLADREYDVSESTPQAILEILDVCPDCDLRDSHDMSVQELVQWIGTEAGFDPDDNNSQPNYFDKSMLVSIRERFLELKDSSTDVTE